jgi:type IV secretory pathway VirB10-like protein
MASGKDFISLLLNTKTRTLVLVVSSVLVVGVIIALTSGSKNTPKEKIPESRTVSVPTDIRSTPGANVSQKHRELLEEANKDGAAKAAKDGKTFLPVITGGKNSFQDNNLQSALAGDFTNSKCSPKAVADLRKAGKDTLAIIKDLKTAGCSADEIARLFNAADIAAALLAADDCFVEDKFKACGADAVKKMKAENIAINEITKKLVALGCEPAAIAKSERAAGFTLNEIATSMKAANLDATTVAKALLDAGFSKAAIIPALSAAGYSPLEIANASNALDKIINAEGLSESERKMREDDAAGLARKMREDDVARREAALREAQQLAVYGQQRKEVITQMGAAMDGKANEAITAWGKPPVQALVSGMWAEENSKRQAGFDNTTSTGQKSQARVLLKAGTILFAVLETAINSDEPGPVLATIVSESLKGAKIMGSMRSNFEAGRITLTFDTLSIPDAPTSMRFSAIGIDPDTARTALATDVDNHYIWRWGALLTSSFVTGYSSAIASAGTTSTATTNPLGGNTTTTTTPPVIDNKKAIFQGIANTGSKFSAVAAKEFDKNPTITIEQGTSIGIFLTADLKDDAGTDNTPSTPQNNVAPAAAAAITQQAVTQAASVQNTSNLAAALATAIAANAGKTETTKSNSGDKVNG